MLDKTPKPKSDWFAVDSHLWQQKLDWPTQKLAIYLREKTHGDHNGLVIYTTKKQIQEDLGIGRKQYKSSIARLEGAFIESMDDKSITLKPLPEKWVKVYRWFWFSKLPEDVKGVLLFLKSCYERTKLGENVYSMNVWGKRQRSVERFCYPTRKRRIKWPNEEYRFEYEELTTDKSSPWCWCTVVRKTI